MKTSFVVFPLVLIFGVTVGLVREHIYIDHGMKWREAQYYCRKYYKDLSTINTTEEKNLAISTTGVRFYSWIGMYRSKENQSNWIWSDDKSSSFSWETGDPGWNNKNCVFLTYYGMFYSEYCWYDYTFFCERILVLVKENKTWEEAYEYCTTHYTGLAFLNSQTQLDLAKEETSETQTASVWTGLRFLAGKWFWVNGEPLWVDISLPSCPAQPYRCGARNVKIDIWENRDCEEKLHFLCYE